MEKNMEISIDADQDGQTVGEYLKKEMHLTKAQIRSLKFRNPGILVNGIPTRTSHILQKNDILTLFLENPRDASLQIEPVESPVEILYEDDDVIGVWKPCQIATHPAGTHQRNTMSNYIMGYLLQNNKNARIRSIGRLDLDTEGILIFAKNKIAASRLWEQRRNHLFFKEYLALCQGSFPASAYEQEQMISHPIVPAEDGTKRMKITEHGPEAITYYQPVARFSHAAEDDNIQTVVRLHLETGRTHQIRVHMASIGHPLVDDPLYGFGIIGESHARLCAWKVCFLQPFTGQTICLTRRPDRIPLPSEFF